MGLSAWSTWSSRTRPSPVAGKVFELASNIPLKMGHASFSKISRVSRTDDGRGGGCCCSPSFSVRYSSPRRKSKSISIALRSRLEFAHFEQLIARLTAGGREILREFWVFLMRRFGLDHQYRGMNNFEEILCWINKDFNQCFHSINSKSK